MTGRKGAVLWDLDGTIADSGELHYLAWRAVLAERGHDHTREEFARAFGKRNDFILRGLFGDALSDAEAARISDDKEERYRRLVRERGLQPLPGVMDWLRRLRQAGWKQALATSAPPANIAASIEALGLDRFLDAAVSAEEVGQGKPDPAIFLEAARRLAVPPERCVVVEDAPPGLEAARRAGMRSIGILSSHFPALDGNLVVASFDELPDTAFNDLLAGR